MTNEEVLNLAKEMKSLYASIKRCRNILIGYTLRHEGLARIFPESTVEGRKRKGRRR